MSHAKELLDGVAANWEIITTGVAFVTAGLAYAFNKQAGKYDLTKHAGCLKRHNQLSAFAFDTMKSNEDVQSIIVGHAENTYVFVRDEDDKDKIKTGVFILNKNEQAAGFFKAMRYIDDPQKVLDIAKKPQPISQVPKDVRKLVRNSGKGWTNNRLQKIFEPLLKISKDKQDLSEAMCGVVSTLMLHKDEKVSDTRSALGLRMHDEKGGVHLVALPGHRLIDESINAIYAGEYADELPEGEITARGVCEIVKKQYSSWCDSVEIDATIENEPT